MAEKRENPKGQALTENRRQYGICGASWARFVAN